MKSLLKKRIGINAKMIFLILTTTTIIYAGSVGYITVNMRSMSLNNAEKVTDSYAREYANLAKANFNVDMNMSRALAQAFLGYKDLSPGKRKQVYNNILKNVLEHNKNFLSVWLIWELSAIDSTWTKDYGRARFTYYRDENKKMKYKKEILDTLGDKKQGAYYQMKVSKEETVMDPYWFSYTGEEEDNILESSVCVPIVEDGEFIGLAGVDLALARFQEIVDKIQPFAESHAFLIANDGTFVAHPDEQNVGEKIQEVDPKGNEKHNILKNIQEGNYFSFVHKSNENNQKRYVSFAPVKIGKSKTPWSIGIVVPVNVILAKANQKFIISLVVGVFGLLILAFIIWLIARNISKPLIKTTDVLKKLSKGDIHHTHKLEIKSNDEIGEMANSVNKLIEGLNRTAKFSEEIGKENLDAKFDLLSSKDVLGNSLIKMRESLKKAKSDEEKRKEADKKRNWTTQGIAKFGEILRQNNDDISKLSFEIINNLVKYLEAKVGGIFILNDENEHDKHLEMTAYFAYDRKKQAGTRIEIGEGLVGSCFKEKRTIYLDKLPEGYMSIASGLGETEPKALLEIPLVTNEDIFGVIEIASLNKFEKYKIEFIEKVAESIASTISSVKINLRTSKLLEQSQMQSEQMRAQEEEMRQNMEELHATQEEMTRKNAEMEGVIEAINASNYVIFYDLDGKIIDFNDAYLIRFNIPDKKGVIGTHHSDNLQMTEKQKKEYNKFWQDLKQGKVKKDLNKFNIKGQTFWFEETYTPIKDSHGKPYKIMKIANDITDSKLIEDKYNKKFEEIRNKEKKMEEERNQLKKKVQELEKENKELKDKKKK